MAPAERQAILDRPREAEAPGSQPRRWTRAEYYRLGELGFFEGQRVELIKGEIRVLRRETPRQCFIRAHLTEALETYKPASSSLRIKAPLFLSDDTEPEPHLAIVPGNSDDYLEEHPSTAILIAETSQSTLASDRREKAPLYAQAKISTYLIVNIPQRQVEVFEDPFETQGVWSYRVEKVIRPGASVSLFGHEVDVAEFFPADSE